MKAFTCNTESTNQAEGYRNAGSPPDSGAASALIIEPTDQAARFGDWQTEDGGATIAAAEGSEKSSDAHTPISRGSHPRPAPGVPPRTFSSPYDLTWKYPGGPLKAGDVLQVQITSDSEIFHRPTRAEIEKSCGPHLPDGVENLPILPPYYVLFEWVANANSAAMAITLNKASSVDLVAGPAKLAPGEDGSDWFGLYRIK